MILYKQKIIRNLHKISCYVIRNFQPKIKLDGKNGYLTIFHDYEGSYSLPDKADASYYGVSKMLDIEKKYNIKVTYNIVGKLIEDVPDIIERIIEDGHEIAGHSYDHKSMTDMTRKNLEKDIQLTVGVFKKQNIKISGMRTPKGKWSFTQMKLMVDNGMIWSVEKDNTDFPYYIIPGRLMRFPVKEGDYYQYAKGLAPEQINQNYIEVVKRIRDNKCYGAIGFHPWVQGENEDRIDAFDELLKKISSMKNLRIVTFKQMYNILQQIIHERK